MKKLFITVILGLAGFASAFSQACDPAQTGLGVAPGVISVGQAATFSFSIFNAGTSPGCASAAGSVTVVLSLPTTNLDLPNFYQFQSFVTPAPVTPVSATGPYFDWTYQPADNVVIGVNRIALPNGLGETVNVRVVGINATSGTGALSNLNISVIGGSNNTQNDVSAATLIVTNLVAVGITDVKVAPGVCQATMSWKTSTDDLGNSFDVEYSSDAANFKTVATLPGKSATGSSYTASVSQPAGKGYYRIKTTGVDGAVSFSSVVNTVVNCVSKKVDIYPNPVQNLQNLNVNLSGYEESAKAEFLTITGQVMQVYTVQNGLNKIAIKNLPQGTYTFRVTDVQGDSQNFKVVVVK